MKVLVHIALMLFVLLAGCSGPPGFSGAPPPNSQEVVFRLSLDQAAELAAELANDECARLYQVRPFRPTDSQVVEEENNYRWGGLDVRGIGGYSALVRFDLDGENPRVEVYYSTDRQYIEPESMWARP